MNSLIEYIVKKRKRRSQPKTWSEHKGSAQDFITMTEAAAANYGKLFPLDDWRRNEYARDMFRLAADPRMLRRAFDSLEGETPGVDGVRPRDIRRYVAYRKWLAALGLHGKKAPPYSGTVFPGASDEELLAVSMLCEPERQYEFEATTFRGDSSDGLDWLFPLHGSELLPLPGNQPYLVMEKAKLLGLRRETLKRAMGVSYPAGIGECLRRAGANVRQLRKITGIWARALADAVVDIHRRQPRTLVGSWTPISLLVRESGPFRFPDEESPIATHLNWEAMRWISRLMLRTTENGKGYRPEPLRRLEIPKSGGGTRALSLPTAVDRIVAKSALLTLEPMFEQIFVPASVGCRSGMDRFDALAGLSRRYRTSGGKFILCADIRKAFDNVRRDVLLDAVGKYIHNPDMLELVGRIIRRGGASGVGIPQGCPLSPLFLNILLHERLDKPFLAKAGPEPVYYRYVDDLSVFGFNSEAEGKSVIAALRGLLTPIGLDLHTEPPKTRIVNLSVAPMVFRDKLDDGSPDSPGTGHEVDRYLGLGLRGRRDGELEFFLPSSWPERIRMMFVEAERKIEIGGYAGSDAAHRHIFNATAAWLRASAPAWNADVEEEVAAVIIDTCRSVSRHANHMHKEALMETWRGAYAWWERVKNGEIQKAACQWT
jgi:hypothetical protein